MTVLMLDKHKKLFKDDDAYRQFAQMLRAATDDDDPRLVLCGEEVVAALVGAERAVEEIRQRILTRLR